MIHPLCALCLVVVFSVCGPSLAQNEAPKPTPPQGRLKVTFEPIHVTAFVDGELVSGPLQPYVDSGWAVTLDGEAIQPRPASSIELEPGRHVVAVGGECFEPVEVEVDVLSGQLSEVTLPMTERTVSMKLQMPEEYAGATGLDVFVEQRFLDLAGSRRSSRFLGTLNDGGSLHAPVCAHDAMAISESLTISAVFSDATDGGRSSVNPSFIRRKDLPGDCLAVMVRSCKYMAARGGWWPGLDPDVAMTRCERQPQIHDGFEWFAMPDLNDDGLPELYLVWARNRAVEDGTLHISRDGVMCADFAGYLSPYDLRVGESSHNGLRDIYMGDGYSSVRSYRFDGSEYRFERIVHCGETMIPEGVPVLPDSPECRSRYWKYDP